MYEFAEEVDSICSSQYIVEKPIEKKIPSTSEFPYEVELRFQADPENDPQRFVRHTSPIKRRFNGSATKYRRNSLQHSIMEEKEVETSKTSSNHNKLTRRKYPFLQRFLCIDCY